MQDDGLSCTGMQISSDSPFVLRLQERLAEYLEYLRRALPDRENSFAYFAENPDALRAMVETLFWASLQRDEGRPIRGTVALCSASEAPRSRSLAEPVALTSQALSTLFTASPATPLGISSGASGTAIWGFVDDVLLHTLLLRVADTGTLVAFDWNGTIAVFERGEVYLPKRASPFDWDHLVSGALGDIRPSNERLTLANRLRQVVEAVHSHGHGGAVVVLPPRSEAVRDIDIAYKLEGTGRDAIRMVVDELAEVQSKRRDLGDFPSGQDVDPMMLSLWDGSVKAHQELLRRALTRVGQLSSIDGALIIDEDLRVLGFGAKLHAPQISGAVVAVWDALSVTCNDGALESLGGTRHQSAAHFVAAHLDSMVFVSSQDGRLSLFAGLLKEQRVVVLRRLEHFLWNV
jgi:DisA bacterial checkpoint controller nucleotide-binding